VAAAVYDADGDPVPDQAVSLSASAAGGGPAGTIAPTVTTDVYGGFQATYTAPLGIGSVVLAAQAGSASVSDTVQVTPASAPEAVTLDLSPGEAAAGAPVRLTGSVVGPGGAAVPDVAVDLTASAPVLPGGSVAAAVYTGSSGSSTGVFRADLTAPTTAGPVLLTATVPSLGVSAAAVLAVGAAHADVTGQAVVFALTAGTVGAGGPGTETPNLTATAGDGAGGVVVVQYGADPAGAVDGTPAQGASSFFDAALTPPPPGQAGFGTATVQDCGLAGPGTAFWWDAATGAWRAVQPQGMVGNCLILGPFSRSTSPSLAQLRGTPFAVATALSASDTLTWSPTPLATTGSLQAGRSVTATVSAENAAGSPLPGVSVYLAFSPAVGGGRASVGGTALTGTAQAFTTDASGQVQVTYTVPATLPNGGTDTVTAASAASNAAVTASNSYSFAASFSGGGVGGSGGGGATALAPVVSGVSPRSGPTAGGTAVTITGAYFSGATAVDFGTVAAPTFQVVSGSEITATAPAGSGTVDVTVRTAYGTSASGGADRFSYSAPASQVPPHTPQTFPDVPTSYWAYGSIEALAAKGIISGFPDGTFRPGAPVTRAQFVKMLDLTLGLEPSAAPTPFTDVTASAWYAPYVSAAVRAGIVKGTTPTTFSPDQPLTREQMAVLLARALKLTKTAALHFNDDAAIGGWALRGVEETVAAGYMIGFPNGSFQPLGTATRAQAAKVLALVLKHTSS
jgi:hypothetical protein